MAPDDLDDVKDPAVAAGILLARAQSYAENRHQKELLRALDRLGHVLSGMRTDETLPFVWRTQAPIAVVRPFAPPRADLPDGKDKSIWKPMPIEREQTTDSRVENCPYACARFIEEAISRGETLAFQGRSSKGKERSK